MKYIYSVRRNGMLQPLSVIIVLLLTSLPYSCYAEELKYNNVSYEKVNALRNDPIFGPLLRCYEFTFEKTVADSARKSKDQLFYTIDIMAKGGFKGIAFQARDACDKWFSKQNISYDPSVSIEEAVKLMGTLFMVVAANEDTSLKEQCLSHKDDPEWGRIIEMCNKIIVIR